MNEKLVSKVLVLDTRAHHRRAINELCSEHGLVAVTASRSRLMSVLRSNIDLGAILCAEDYAGSAHETLALALAIRAARPELPIILCRSTSADLGGLPDAAADAYCAAFTLDDTSPLREVIAAYIFNLAYPNALVRGIAQISEEVLASQFPGLSIQLEVPRIVRDRIICGEVFTLIPLDCTWCRGYMQLLVDESPVLRWLESRRREGESSANFRTVNSILGEITNLIWGAFKNRYIGDAAAFSGSQIQVPIVVNQPNRYMSFGTENPQLSFSYSLSDEATGIVIALTQRFVFNLSWAPDDFKEIIQEATELVDSGELELF